MNCIICGRSINTTYESHFEIGEEVSICNDCMKEAKEKKKHD